MRKKFFYSLILSIFCVVNSQNQNRNNYQNLLKISVFFDDTYDDVKRMVSYAVESINPLIHESKFQIEYSLMKLEKKDYIKVISQLCDDLEQGRIAVITIGKDPIYNTIFSIASSMSIPYISIKWDTLHMANLKQNYGNINHTNPMQFHINLHHPANKLMRAVIDLISFYGWNFVTILFHESNGLERIEDLLSLHQAFNIQDKVRLKVNQLSSNMSKWESLLREIKTSGSSHIVVDIQTRHLSEFIKMAEDIGLLTSYFHFVFINLDFSLLEYTPSANISVFQAYEPDNLYVQTLLAEYNLRNMVSNRKLYKYLPNKAVLIYDAFLLLARTIDQNNLLGKIKMSRLSISCENPRQWTFGAQFMKFLKSNKFQSVSGHIEFDKKTGYRKNITLAMVDKTKNGVDLIGYWRENTQSGKSSIEIVRSYAKEKDLVLDRLKRNLIVTTKLEAPYAMLKKSKDNGTYIGNDQYRGYCIDLLEKISKMCGFNYTIHLVEDGYHGSLVNGKWNGMVNEIIENKVDLAVAALSISTVRERVIDFTNPFLNLGISILYKRPAKRARNLFSFLSPLTYNVWFFMLIAFIVVSIFLFVLSHLSPYEWKKKPQSDILENQWSFSNSFWFIFSNLVGQGTTLNISESPSIRLVSILWSFFTLILISSYTANLAAFLTVQRMQSTIQSVEDLSKQTEVKYGSIKSGSTENFFKESNIETYEKMWAFMKSNPSVFVKSTEEGIARIKAGGYAYLLESTTNEYIRQRDCDLIQVGGLLDTKGYGIATPTNSPWRNLISNAILELQEKGDLQELYTKWWTIEDVDKQQMQCENTDDKTDTTSELSFDSIGGIFIIMAVGICLACLIAILEFFYKAYKTSKSKKQFFKNIRNGFTEFFRGFSKRNFANPFSNQKSRVRQQDLASEIRISDEHKKFLNTPLSTKLHKSPSENFKPNVCDNSEKDLNTFNEPFNVKTKTLFRRNKSKSLTRLDKDYSISFVYSV